MLLSVRAATTYQFADESSLCLMIEPPERGVAHRVIEARLVTEPRLDGDLRQDLYGNPVRHLTVPAGRLSFEYTGRIEVQPNQALPLSAIQHAQRELPPEVFVYTLPSRYCQSDLLSRMANDEFGQLPPGGERVLKVSAWVRKHVEYRYGTTDAMTSAYDTATERIGVCRDFAHLTIAFCRALGIPARYVSGYVLGLDPADFHGYAQVYLGSAWHSLDATFEGLRPALIPIAHGRDAADVAMATIWGPCTLESQTVEVQEVSPPADRPWR